VLGNQTVAGFNYATSGVAQGDELHMLAVAAFPDVSTFRESATRWSVAPTAA
jgi:hypothetical protein